MELVIFIPLKNKLALIIELGLCLEDKSSLQLDFNDNMALLSALGEGDQDSFGEVFADLDRDLAGLFVGRKSEPVNSKIFMDLL